ncbi:MAG: hypothetical protein QM742_12275 [Aquabacterium sp.]
MIQAGKGLLALAIAFATGGAAHAAPAYTITEIGTLGGAASMAVSINASGQIAGSAVTATGQSHAFLYDRGVMTDVLAGRDDVFEGVGIVNDLGQVAGDYYLNDTGVRAAFVYDQGTLREWRAADGGSLTVRGFNNAGELAGTVMPASGAYQRAFALRNGQIVEIGSTEAGAVTQGHGINQSGWMAISVSSMEAGIQTALVGPDGSTVALTAPGEGTWFGNPQINDHRAVAGTAMSMSMRPRAMLFAGQSWTDLGALDAYSSMAMGINNRNDVVGTLNYYTPWGDETQEAFAYVDGQMRKLGSLIDPASGWQLKAAMDINDRGQIVGYGVFNGQERGFLLTPVPEPDALALVAAGMLAFSLHRAGAAATRRRRHR